MFLHMFGAEWTLKRLFMKPGYVPSYSCVSTTCGTGHKDLPACAMHADRRMLRRYTHLKAEDLARKLG